MSSRIRLVAGGTATYVVAVGLGYGYSTYFSNREIKHICTTVSEVDRYRAFSKNANKYDNEIGRDEIFMGLNWIRWWQIRKSQGEVLEIGCGTGRNFPYYNMKKVNHLTAIDSVTEMLEQAKKKITANDKITFQQMNAHELQFKNQSFDVVIDTFGLCSYENPNIVLKEMSRVCKPNGKILLVEHGKGSYDFINQLLDRGALNHAQNWGCIWNRDIEKIVLESGLKIQSISRWHFGTTYVIEASPADSSVPTITHHIE